MTKNATLWGDKNLIEQVIINLINNAIEATNQCDTKKILLQVAQHQHGKINISLSDSGSGISKENLENIFVPFYTTKENGTGIGLSLSRQIMSMHKGNITVSSVVGKGTCFNLAF